MTVAAIVLLKDEELIAHFRAHGACSRASAMTLRALAISDDMTFRRLRDRAVIREGAAGTFYLDEETVVARERTTRRLRSVLLIIAPLAAIVAIVLLALMRRGAQT